MASSAMPNPTLGLPTKTPAQRAANQARQQAAAAAQAGGVKPAIPGTVSIASPPARSLGSTGPTSTPTPSPATPVTPVPGTSTTNTAAPDPGVSGVMGKVDKFIDEIPGTAGTMMDVAGGKLRDAYEGIQKGVGADAARRGVAGSGIEATLHARANDKLQRDIAAQQADIALGQRAQNLSALGVAGNLATGRANLQQGQQGLNQSALAGDRAYEQQNFQQQQALLQNLREPSYHPEQTWNAPVLTPAPGSQVPGTTTFGSSPYFSNYGAVNAGSHL